MVELKTSTSGTLLEVCGIYPDGHVLHWQVVRRISAAAILLSSQTLTSFANLADDFVLNLVTFGERHYYDLQRERVCILLYTSLNGRL